MPAEVMLNFLNQCSLESRLGFQVASHCAPVLKGVKISNIMSAEPGTCQRLLKALKGSRVLCVTLSALGERELLLLYRYEKLRDYLEKEQVQKFLKDYGYEDMSVAAVIMRLRTRYARYTGNGEEFPHELGVILEYPLEDVKGFIENQGKNCMLEKYWKVYHDKEGAKAVFARYDQAKETAMREIMAGYPLYQVAVG